MSGKPTKHPQFKQALFVCVLTEMKATWWTWVHVRLYKVVVWPDWPRWSIPHQRGGCGCLTVHACVSVHVYWVILECTCAQCVNDCMMKLIHDWLLCHLQVYHLTIELVARWHLNVQSRQVLTPGTNINRLTVEDVIKSELVLGGYSNQLRGIQCWTIYYRSLPTWGSQSVDHDSFGKDWTMKFVSKYIQERNKKDIETETVAYINNVTVACNLQCCFS